MYSVTVLINYTLLRREPAMTDGLNRRSESDEHGLK
jgi:hypothetical protein